MECNVNHNFPEGLRVLVVDNDPLHLKEAREILVSCTYKVTTCANPRSALTLFRERCNDFDLLLAEVHMPEFSGFELLTIANDELDLPVIMMSTDKRLETIKVSYELGASFFLVKPLDVDTAKNIWQHVVSSRHFQRDLLGSKIYEASSKEAQQIANKFPVVQAETEKNCGGKSVVISDSSCKGNSTNLENTADVVISDSSCKRDSTNLKNTAEKESSKPTEARKGKKRGQTDEQEEQNPKEGKKRLVVWDEEMEKKFREAIEALGIDAIPSKILKHMNVEGITRTQVASHLQKYRLKQKNKSRIPSIPLMLSPGAGIGQINQASNQCGLLNAQPSHPKSLSMNTIGPVNHTAPFGLLNAQPSHPKSLSVNNTGPVNHTAPFEWQPSPDFFSYPNASYVKSCIDKLQHHQNIKANQNQGTSNIGITGEIQRPYSTSTLGNNMNSLFMSGGVNSSSFEANIQTQQTNGDAQLSSSLEAIIQQQKFNSGTQVSEAFRASLQPHQLLKTMAPISEKVGNFPYAASGSTNIGLFGNNSNNANAMPYNASEQHTHLVSENSVKDYAEVVGATMNTNHFSFTDSEQQHMTLHNASEENTILASEIMNIGIAVNPVTDSEQQHMMQCNAGEGNTLLFSENMTNHVAVTGGAINANQSSINNFEQQCSHSQVPDNSKIVEEEENLDHMIEKFAYSNDTWPLML